jgi:hypothetical protein
MILKVAPFAVAAMCVAATSFGQEGPKPAPTPSSSGQVLNEWVDRALQAAQVPIVREPFGSTLGHGGGSELIAYLIAKHSEGQSAPEPYKALVKAMETRAIKQIGSTPSSAGTTSVAMKGTVPEILGVAVENGAIIRDVDGTTLTFRTTPTSLLKALQKTGLDAIYEEYAKSAAARFASRFSVAASFDTSLGPLAGTFTADRHQLTGWSVRAEISNDRSPKSPNYGPAFRSLLNARYAAAAAAVNTVLDADRDFLAWEGRLKTATVAIDAELNRNRASVTAAATAAGRFRKLLVASLPDFLKIVDLHPELLASVDDYVVELQGVQDGLDDLYDFIDRGSLSTADWSTTRDEVLPDLYIVTFDWDQGLGKSRQTDFTFNAAISFYRSTPLDSDHQFKSFDAAVQFDHPLGSLGSLPPVLVTGAARVSYLPEDVAVSLGSVADDIADVSVPTTVGIAPKGGIVVVQGKLTIPIGDSGIKVPLSITASNRTELIKEKDIRANFGVTFDLDAVLSGLRIRR